MKGKHHHNDFIGSFAISFEGKVEESDIEMDHERLESLAQLVVHLLSDINFLSKMSKDKIKDISTASISLEDNSRMCIAVGSEQIKVVIK